MARERQDTIDAELAAIVEHTPRAAAADEAVERKRAEWDAAVRERQHLEAEHRSVIWPLQHRRNQIEGDLSRLASPLIGKLRESLQSDIETASAQRDAVRANNIEGRTMLVWSNGESVAKRIEAIVALRNEIANWYLDVLSDDQIQAKFESCRAEFPVVETRPAKYRGAA